MNDGDRELLELAAKAAGINIRDGEWAGGEKTIVAVEVDEVGHVTGIVGPWNPLEDDGDALRLAVKLMIFCDYAPDRYAMFSRFYREALHADLQPSTATRRAIVRAAAEMGRCAK